MDQEIDLLAQEVQENREKIEVLIRKITPFLFNFLKKHTRNKEDAEDILQETLLSITISLPLWSGKGHFLSFCYAIARHELADFYLKEKLYKIREKLKVVLKRIIDSSFVTRVENKMLVRLMLEKLPWRYGLVLVLKYSYGFSVKEIAKKLGTTPKATEALLFRARIKGREILRSNE